MGPASGPDAWGRSVRAGAQRVGLRIRTGEARCTTSQGDGQGRPWAVTVEGYEAMRTGMGGLELSTLGAMVATADPPAGMASMVAPKGR